LRPPGWARTLESLPPSLRARLAGVLASLPAAGTAAGGAARARLAAVFEAGASWFGAEPSLAELGYWMIEPRHPAALRGQGCVWLAQFPSAETAKRLAQVALDDATPEPVREHAIRSLGDRQLRGHHPATQWTGNAVQLADEALVRIASAATARGLIASRQLPHALRHVASDGLTAAFARAPGLWGGALECFASLPLARVLAVSIDDIAPEHRVRVLRLVAATLGEEAIPLMLARVPRAPVGEQLEMALLAIACGGEVHVGVLEDLLRGKKLVEPVRARARWHLENRGVVPTVRGLRVARTTAILAAPERATRCAQAADDLGALTRFERHAEAYVYTMWGWMVRGAADPARARELAWAHPASQALVRDLYLEDLARHGRVAQLMAAAHTLDSVDLGAYQLAVWGRPLAALALSRAARQKTPALVCARALACYRAGRPDLTDKILAEDLPPSEITGAGDGDTLAPFPGADEQWRLAHAAPGHPGYPGYPAGLASLAALVAGREAIIALAQPAPHDADPDISSIEPVVELARREDRRSPGATVYLAGELAPAERDPLVAAIEAAGARVVAGPVPGTDYYVRGASCPVQTIARLERQGARRWRELPVAPPVLTGT
jgi:hypothetical protein